MPTASPPLQTIGYEGTTIDAVLERLRAARVALLIDVRAVAASRKPGFSKRQLAAGLDAAGIGYVHLQGLGTPKPGRDAVRAGHPERMPSSRRRSDWRAGRGPACCASSAITPPATAGWWRR